MEQLTESPYLPFDHTAILHGGVQLSTYLRRLVDVLGGTVHYEERRLINSLISVTGVGTVYFAEPDEGGLYPANTLRLYADGTTLTLQSFDGVSTWTTITSITLAGLLTTADVKLNSPSQIYLLDHDSFAGFVSNEHIDHTVVSINTTAPLSGGGNIGSTRTLSLRLRDTDLDVDGFNDLYVVDSGINHDATTNFVADEHIDHTGVSILAGDGMSGGGTIAASRTLTNADKGTTARTAHESAYDHSKLHDAASVADTASIDLTLTGQQISGAVLPAGVNHNLLGNYVAAEHTSHASAKAGTVGFNDGDAIAHVITVGAGGIITSWTKGGVEQLT